MCINPDTQKAKALKLLWDQLRFPSFLESSRVIISFNQNIYKKYVQFRVFSSFNQNIHVKLSSKEWLKLKKLGKPEFFMSFYEHLLSNWAKKTRNMGVLIHKFFVESSSSSGVKLEKAQLGKARGNIPIIFELSFFSSSYALA